jgi:hypothetical protein
MNLGYCLSPDDQDAILANPPADPEAFVDAVLVAEGRNPDLIVKDDKTPLLAIVTKWAVYDDSRHGAHQDRPRFPSPD